MLRSKNPESRFSRPTRKEILAAATAFTLAAGGVVGYTQLNGDNEKPHGHTVTQSIEEKYPDLIIEPSSVPLGPLQPRIENRHSR